MRSSRACNMDSSRNVFVFLETLFDIVRLRKGPDAIPYSSLLLLAAVVLWLFAGVVMTVLTRGLTGQDFLYGTLTGLVGLGCYAAIVVASGKAPRLMQTATAVLGCGALLSLFFIAGNVFLAPVLGENLADIITTLILLWSIPVEGHIVARAIDRHWYVGVVAAMAVFVFQLFLYSMINPAAGQAG